MFYVANYASSYFKYKQALRNKLVAGFLKEKHKKICNGSLKTLIGCLVNLTFTSSPLLASYFQAFPIFYQSTHWELRISFFKVHLIVMCLLGYIVSAKNISQAFQDNPDKINPFKYANVQVLFPLGFRIYSEGIKRKQ